MVKSVRLGDVAEVWQGLVTSGAGAGSREGDWPVRVIESGDIQNDVVEGEHLRTLLIDRNAKTEKHLLRPYDVLITARSTALKVGLIEPNLTSVMAGSTLLVVRSLPQFAVGRFLWYFFTSSLGRLRLEERIVGSTTISSLSGASVRQVELPLPALPEATALTNLIEESERAYAAAVEAAELRRAAVRDAIISAITHRQEG